MILQLTDICKDYVTGQNVTRALRNVCLNVYEGDYLAIMGPSGSGKTTLMNIIGCLDVPTSGIYRFGDYRNFPVHEQTARVLQKSEDRICFSIFSSFAEADSAG